MPLSTKSSTLHLTSTSGAPAFRPFTCVINPVVLFSILDHYLRRNEGQERVIGTLLGVRSDDGTEVEIRNCFNVPHQENDSEVAVDMEHHRAMFELHQRVNPREVIVGWYATGSKLNSYSALIQDFYSGEVAPFQAVHLTMDTDLAIKGSHSMGLQTHIRYDPLLIPHIDAAHVDKIIISLAHQWVSLPSLETACSFQCPAKSDISTLSEVDVSLRPFLHVTNVIGFVNHSIYIF